ncbi:MAG: terpene synthase family protein [Nannocystaceae bacterium]
MASPLSTASIHPAHELDELERGAASEWEPVDAESTRLIVAPLLRWAGEHGLWDTSDRRASMPAVTAARLVAAAFPERREADLVEIASVAVWLTRADEALGRERLIDALAGAPHDGDRTPLVRAANALRFRLGARASILRGLVADAERAQDAEVRVIAWLERLCPALLGARMPRIHEVSLSYPTTWSSGVNPLANQVEAEVGEWLRSVGVIRSERGEAVFADLAAAEYAGWPCADADHERLATVMGFFSLWIFHDDCLEGTGTLAIERHARAVAGDVEPATCGPDAPHLRGWAELGRSLKRTMSDTWLRRHGDRFHEWLSAVGWEALALKAYRRTGVAPSVAEYLHLRRSTIGVSPTLDFVEYVQGAELTPAQIRSAPVAAIGELAADLVAIHNDLFAFSKDVRQSMMNLVSSRMADDVAADRAFAEIAELHNRKVRALEAAAAEFVDAAPVHERPGLERWVAGVQRMIHGFARWHVLAPRYTDIHRLPGGEVLRVRILVH